MSTIVRILTSTSDPILPPDGPESTATYGHTNSATAYTAPTVISGGSTGGANLNVGAIAGSVTGGVVGLALIALLGIWLFRRRKSDHVAPPSLINTDQYHPGSPTLSEGKHIYHHTGSSLTTSGPSMRLSGYVSSTCFLSPTVWIVFRGKGH